MSDNGNGHHATGDLRRGRGDVGTLHRPDPLPDNRPFSAAAAFMAEQQFADVTYVTTGSGKDVPENVKPTRHAYWGQDHYEYTGKVWRRVDREEMHSRIGKFLSPREYFAGDGGARPLRVTGTYINDVDKQVRVWGHLDVPQIPFWRDRREDPSSRDIIAFDNGLLDVRKWLRDPDVPLMPHTPEWFSTSVLPYDFDPAARCPKWSAFLAGSLIDQAVIAVLHEFLGYCMTADTAQQRFAWMHGVSGAGKSTAQDTAADLVGADNVVRFDLWDLAGPFGVAPWMGKRLALAADAHLSYGPEAAKVLAKLKQLTAGDEQAVNRKNKDVLESVKIDARIMVSTNEFPTLPESAGALARRAIFIPFNQSFIGHENPHLRDELRRELPGIANEALAGLRRLRERGRFLEPAASQRLADDFRRAQNPVKAFVDDWCTAEPDPDNEGHCYAWLDDLYAKFEQWAKVNGWHPMKKPQFAAALNTSIPNLGQERPRGQDGARPRLYHGIRILPDSERPAAQERAEFEADKKLGDPRLGGK